MNWQNLIKLAREMAAAPPSDHLHQAHLRLAVSSAHYAMYHALARSNADLLAGSSEAERNLPEWARTYTALGGDSAADRLPGEWRSYVEGIRNFLETFVVLNGQRLAAEQDPVTTFTADEALAWIEQAEAAITPFCPWTPPSAAPWPFTCWQTARTSRDTGAGSCRSAHWSPGTFARP